jgi:hypothetical protein
MALLAVVSLVLILLKICVMLVPIEVRTKIAAAPIRTRRSEYSNILALFFFQKFFDHGFLLNMWLWFCTSCVFRFDSGEIAMEELNQSSLLKDESRLQRTLTLAMTKNPDTGQQVK